MTWIGLKRIAMVPVHRPNAHPPDEPVPADWPAEIMRRTFYDRQAGGGADRSLRAFIHAASSGRADVDAVVLPLQIVDQQDVPPDLLEGAMGEQLRSQGFDAAALVMLGQPPTGQGQRGGFWARFDMSEGVGVWAMELMHCLTGFDDLYPFGGNLDGFDNMASSGGSHPTAYTKAAVQWLDSSAIAQHSGPAVTYDLHDVGLVQPPPVGRRAAVRIGASVPYLMVEARARVDQFDAMIPAEGVIVYRVQTTSPLGSTQNQLPPVELLTVTSIPSPSALDVGGVLTTDNGVTVRVLGSIPGGMTVRIEDPNAHLVDRSAEYDTPEAAGRPTAWIIPGQGVHDIGYRDTGGSLHELWRDSQGGTGTTDLTAVAGAIPAAGDPFAYLNTARDQTILLYRDSAGTVRSLYWTTGAVGMDNLSDTAGAPKAEGDPVGYYHAPLDTHHVIYRTAGGHFQELWWTGDSPVAGGGDLIGSASAPPSAGEPSALVNASGVHIVVYRSDDGVIHDLYWTTGAVTGEDLSGTAGTPRAAGDPVAYYTAHDDTHQVAYVGQDGHVWELYWPGVAPVVGWDLTALSGAPDATGVPAAYYSAGTNTKHVFFRSGDDQLHELWWVPGGGAPAHVNLTVAYGLPAAASDPTAFTVEGPNTQHVVYRGTDGHLYEALW